MSTGTFTSGVKVEKDKQPGWLTKHTMLAYGVLTYGISWGIAIALVTAMQNGMLNPDGTLASVLVQIAAASPALAALVVIAATRGRARLARFCTPKITSQKWPFDGQHHPGCFLGPVALTKSCTVGQAPDLHSLPVHGNNDQYIYSYMDLQPDPGKRIDRHAASRFWQRDSRLGSIPGRHR